MEKIWSIDRIEEDMAICRADDGDKQNIPLINLPGGVGEGDILCESNGLFVIDREETKARRKMNADFQKKLRWE